MATKSKSGGMHTAGIYSDMTVDGPEIGTLVVIVDRAKNLPSRKTIGKQDPYCACRLGKEAKKTETDRRGGQTPRWDQELRFTVHDSADYYQLKVSVFNDDKKTDLIGETWVNLQDVVISGGGVSDIWHNLSCKGKYAGEIRIEITYYDTRPKQEKAVEKVKQINTSTTSLEEGATESLKGPRQPQQKAAVKRRPLPSDPITGAPPPAPIATPIAAPIPVLEQPGPRGYPQAIPTSGPEQVQPRGYPQPAPVSAPEPLPRGYSQPQTFIPEHVQAPVRGYPAPNAIPAHVQTPPRGPGYIPNQSPLQSVEYQQSQYHQPEQNYSQEPKHNQSELGYSQQEPDYSQHSSYEDNSAQNGYGGMPRAVTPTPSAHPDDRYGYDSRRNDYNDRDGMNRYGDEEDHNSYQFDRHSAYELPQSDEYSSPPSPEGPPPPPPVHRSRHGSAQPSPAPQMPAHGSFDSRQQRPHYGIPSQDGHRHSMPDYQKPDYQNQTYQPYRSPTREEHSSNLPHEDFQESPPHHSYDSRYEHHDYNTMQPTVEDAPPSPSGRDYSASPAYRGESRDPYEDRGYEKVPSPAPLNLNGRGSANSGYNSISTTPSHQYSISSMNYGSQISQLSYRDRANTDTTVSSRNSYNQQPQAQLPRRMSENPAPMDYNNMPPVPPSLVAGMDPAIAQEISDRIYDEKRASFRNSGNVRGYQNSPQYQSKPHPLSYQEPANPQYGSAPNSPYDDRQGRISNSSTAIVKTRAISPDPRRSIARKSVSPAPYDDRGRFSTSTAMVHTRGVSPNPRRPIRKSVSPAPGPPPGESDTRRLSGIPFGPDSYNAFNPTIANSASTSSLGAKYDIKEIDPDAKIITHDGREIDPSDHIPETNWAPLRETKAPKYASQLPDRNYRPPPVTTATAPASGRRPLRVAPRPQSMATSAPVFHSGDPSTPPNRNRLQKKSNRISAQPAPYSSPSVPTTSYQDNYTPRSQARDYGTDNYEPQYRRGSNVPPIPAKVPMQITASPHTPGTSDPWALLEEMKNIDLGMGGTGRARRRQY